MPRPAAKRTASTEAREYSGRGGVDHDPDDGFEIDDSPVESTIEGLAAQEISAGPDAGGERLDKWLATQVPAYSRARLQQWIVDGFVTVNGRAAPVRQPVWAGDRIHVRPQASAEETAFRAEDVPLAVVHEDAAILVIDKPAGLVVHPGSGNWSGTVLNGLLHRDPALASVPRAGIVHRLDKDTSGLMVVARTLAAQTDLVRQLQARTVGRTYLAIVRGEPPAEGRVALSIGRDRRDRTRMAAFDPATHADDSGIRPAATNFTTLSTREGPKGLVTSLVRCRLETGRTHQIRVHLQAIGHPLVGDATYGGHDPRVTFGRQALHAWRLGLNHPDDGLSMVWTAPPPADFQMLAATLGHDLEPE